MKSKNLFLYLGYHLNHQLLKILYILVINKTIMYNFTLNMTLSTLKESTWSYNIRKVESGWAVTNHETQREFIVSLTAKTVLDRSSQETFPINDLVAPQNKLISPQTICLAGVMGGIGLLSSYFAPWSEEKKEACTFLGLITSITCFKLFEKFVKKDSLDVSDQVIAAARYVEQQQTPSYSKILQDMQAQTSEESFKIIKPVAMGITFHIFETIALEMLNYLVGKGLKNSETFRTMRENSNQLQIDLSQNFFKTCILGPLIEEIFWREILFKYIHELAHKIVSDEPVQLLGFQVRKDALISCTVQGVLFGLFHYPDVETMIEWIPSGILLGILQHKYGLLAPITSHIAHNMQVYFRTLHNKAS